jgi:hypothetical protein
MPGLTVMKTFLLISLLAAAALAGCGEASDEPGAGGAGTTTPVFVDQVTDSDEPQLVTGNLLVADGGARLCSALAESFPPQCGEPSLRVAGLDLGTVPGLTTNGGVSWTDHPIELRGVVSDGTLTVGDTAGGESTEARPGPAVEVTVTFWPKGEDNPPQEATLTCDPVGGTHPNAEKACAALAADPAALEPVPPDQACTMIFGGPEQATVVGVVDGEQVEAAFSRSNGCEVDRWERMAALLQLGD